MHDLEATGQGWLVASTAEKARGPVDPLTEAIACLRESRVAFGLFQRDFEAPQRSSRLDVLVAAEELEVALAAVRRPGFREMRTDAEGSTHLLLSYENDRMYCIAVHSRFEAAGVQYMDAALALSRRDVRGPWPRLCAEDRFLQMLLQLALEGRKPRELERLELLALRREQLETNKLAAQTTNFGLRRAIEGALPALDRLVQERQRWRRFRFSLWVALLRRPGNRGQVWRAWKRRNLKLRHRPVVLAVMGPPGAGKTAFIDHLAELLDGTPFSAGRVSMSCWAGSHAWKHLCGLLAPVEPSYARLRQGRRGGGRRPLTEEEWRLLREGHLGNTRLLLGSLRQSVQSALFGALLQVRMGMKVVRGIWRCQQPLVLADGWIGDLGYRLGQPAWLQGRRRPPRLLRRIALPDGLIYRATSFAYAASRKPQLRREQFENVDLGLRRMLRPLQPVEFIGDESPRHVARTFLRHYWAHVLERHNQRV